MPAVIRLAAAALCALVAASAVHAQQRVRPATNVIPSASARITQSAPSPSGLQPRFPAGVSSGSGGAVSPDPIARSTTPIPPTGGTAAQTTIVPTDGVLVDTSVGSSVTLNGSFGAPVAPVAPATNVMGAYGAGAGAQVRGPDQRMASGAGGFSATDQARSFFFADANKDGELTRAEYARLSIATMAFEEADRNFDGVVSRFEYDDTLR